MIKVGSDFSGVGAFDYACKRVLGEENIDNVFACDMDKYARQSYLANHKSPKYYPENVYEREIPSQSLDIYMTSPPCQSFSLAGKRKGKADPRGILFFNSLEFIQENNPRYFIFENVKGLISDDNGNTFQEWINYLGGKSVNGSPVIFPFDNSVPYHIYWKVLNSKKYGVPQNRERVFVVGIRDDRDNVFSWPKEVPLTKKLKNVLESEVDEKYFLSEKAVNGLISHTEKMKAKGNGFSFKPKTGNDVGSCVTARCYKVGVDDNFIKIKSATENDSINLTHLDSKTRRGRVGKSVAQTLDTSCNQGVFIPCESKKKDGVIVSGNLKGGKWNKTHEQSGRVYSEEGISPTIHTMGGGNQEPKICVPVLTPDRKEKRQNGRRFKDDGEEIFTITRQDRHGVFDGFRIRKLTPRECFRLQNFPDSFKFVVSNSQLYKQAGNSITVKVLELIIKKLKL